MAENRVQRIRAGNLFFHITEWGPPGKPPVILLHGLASTHHMFDLVAPELAQNQHIIAFDQRGHGQSDKPDQGYDFASIASDLDRIVTELQLPEPFALIGHSWGGYTSLYYAATRPQKVAKAVLIDGGTKRFQDTYPTWEEAAQAMQPPAYINRSLDDIKKMIREEWLGRAFRPELESLALSVFDTHNPDDVKAHLERGNHMQIAQAIWSFDPQHYYPRIQCPTMLIYAVPGGEQPSPDIRRYAETARQSIADARVVWMEDSIHDIPWHRPAELSKVIIEFLKT